MSLPFAFLTELDALRTSFAVLRHQLRQIRRSSDARRRTSLGSTQTFRSHLPVGAAKYDPDQPRVPAGNPGGGQWTDSGGQGLRLADIIRICVLSGIARSVDVFGTKTYAATYDCIGGRSFTRRGMGHDAPGLVRDPFR